ncbi:hypothetical protein GCM10017562_64420 [Streptomyces roseofulvus]
MAGAIGRLGAACAGAGSTASPAIRSGSAAAAALRRGCPRRRAEEGEGESMARVYRPVNAVVKAS